MQKTATVCAVIAGMFLWSCILAGCGRPGAGKSDGTAATPCSGAPAPEKIDARLPGIWEYRTVEVWLVIELKDDGTFKKFYWVGVGDHSYTYLIKGRFRVTDGQLILYNQTVNDITAYVKESSFSDEIHHIVTRQSPNWRTDKDQSGLLRIIDDQTIYLDSWKMSRIKKSGLLDF